MDFPVDVLGSVSHEALEQEAQAYMTDLRYVSLDKAQSFTLNNHRKIRITLSNVGFVPIYGGDLKHKVLALFAPEDQLTAVALLLAGQWWSVEDILTTSDPSRTGLLKVRSVVERIVLYVLNRIVYRVSEMERPEIPFLCHGQRDFAKILWKEGQAAGFYSVKPKDSLCNHFVTQCYQLPVMDSIFIRKCHRGNGHGLEMLEDLVDSFKEDQLGLKYPLSIPMYKVCSKYLSRYPADEDLLWVVEGVGGPYQRESVAGKLRNLRLKVSQPLATANGDHGLTPLTGDLDSQKMEDGDTHLSCLDITEDIIVVNKPLKLVEDLEETPVSTRTRSSGGQKRDRDQTEDLGERQPPKMSRLEDEDGDTEATAMATEEDGEGEEKECSGPVEAEGPVAPEEQEDPALGRPALGVEEVNGELTDDLMEEVQEEEEEGKKSGEEEDCREPESALETGAAEDDVEMEGGKEEEEEEEKKEEVPKDMDTVDAAPVESPTAEAESPPLSEEEPIEAPLTPPPAPEGASLPGERAEESEEEPPASLEPATHQEPPAMEGGEDSSPADSSSGEAVLLVGVAELSYQPPEEEEEEEEEGEEGRQGEVERGDEGEVAEQEGKMEAEGEAVTTEDEEGEDGEDDAGDVRAARGTGRGGRRAAKRQSKRLSQVPAEGGDSEVTEVNEEEEEEEAVTTEDEAHAGESTLIQEMEEDKEEELEEEEEEEPPVVDQRALRRKSKAVKSPPKSKGKRRSKT